MGGGRDNESGENYKESPGEDVEVMWTCDEMRGTLRRKEGLEMEVQ